MKDYVILFFAIIVAMVILALKGLIVTSLIVVSANLFGLDLSEYFGFMWAVFTIFFTFVK